VIFGASGDLTRRKLLPALWNNFAEGRLPDGFSVVGVARSESSREGFREDALEAVREHSRLGEPSPERWEAFAAGLHYLQVRYDDPATYAALKRLLDGLCQERGSCGNHLFYLATPPSGYGEIVRQLGEARLAVQDEGGPWRRIIVEKPFGTDLPSARRLNQELRAVFSEGQIYRIDHYLGKETVQNLLVFRLANGIFEPIWNRRYVDHVQISAAEELGVEGRGSYYEETGALRDMVQNHLLQVMCLVAMEPPTRLDPRHVRNEKMKVLEAVRPMAGAEACRWTVRGQYAGGIVGEREVPGYREEADVSPVSQTETYAAVRFLIDNWRWADVPFYLRSGKRLADRVTEVSIHFRRAPHLLFRSFGCELPERNVLTMRIQPNEGIALRFGAKVPGAGMEIRPVTMRFDYDEEFHRDPPEAYERLLLDAMLGDISLFSRDDWMERSWELIDPIEAAWREHCQPLPRYPAGAWGPAEADELLARDGRSWWTAE
jgi:glucose-6-phosphate 1-dehydrogenase